MAARSERSTAATKKKASPAPKAAAASRAPSAPAKAATPAKAAAKPPVTAASKAPARPVAPAGPAGKVAATTKPAKATPVKAAPVKPVPVKASKVEAAPRGKVEAKPSKVEARPARAEGRAAPAGLVVKKPAVAGKKGEAAGGKKPAARHEEPASGPRKGEPAAKKGSGASRVPAPAGKRVNLDRSPPPPRTVSKPPPRLSLRPPPPPRQPTLEERSAAVEARLARTSEEFRKAYTDRFDMSWIFHDAALEGVVYTEQELRAALDPNAPPVAPESSLKPIVEEIRRHREAIAYTRDQATKKRQPVTSDMLKKIYLIMHPEEGDVKSVKYRKEVPQHRLYFHEYAAPDKIATKVRQVIDWVNDPETRKTRGTMRISGRAHFDLLRAFPFPTDSGKVARLFLNLMLMRVGYPPAVIHSTDRQRYYEALKGSAIFINQMVQEALENSLASIEKLLDEYEARVRALRSAQDPSHPPPAPQGEGSEGR